MSKRYNLVGKTFGRLTVTKYLGSINKKWCWECVCLCGNIKNFQTGALTNERGARSCGCLLDEGRKKGTQALVNRNKKPEGHAAFEGIYGMYRTSARERGFEFNLSRDEFEVLTSLPCRYCGVPPLQKFKRAGRNPNGQYLHNGIDRVDSSLGYISGNCVPCCTICNYAKGNKTTEMFLAWIDRLAAYRSIQKLAQDVPGFDEALLAILIDRLQGFQSGAYECAENADALWHCQKAMEALHRRTRARLARGVEGTHQV